MRAYYSVSETSHAQAGGDVTGSGVRLPDAQTIVATLKVAGYVSGSLYWRLEAALPGGGWHVVYRDGSVAATTTRQSPPLSNPHYAYYRIVVEVNALVCGALTGLIHIAQVNER